MGGCRLDRRVHIPIDLRVVGGCRESGIWKRVSMDRCANEPEGAARCTSRHSRIVGRHGVNLRLSLKGVLVVNFIDEVVVRVLVVVVEMQLGCVGGRRENKVEVGHVAAFARRTSDAVGGRLLLLLLLLLLGL